VVVNIFSTKMKHIKYADQWTIIQQYSDWYTGFDGWAGTFGTERRRLGGLRPRPVPSSTNFILFDVALPLHSKGLITRGQSNLTKSASRGAHSPVKGHPRGVEILYH